MLSFKPAFSLSSFTFLKRLFLMKKGSSKRFLFAFCCRGGVICISEVIDISPGNLDSSCDIDANTYGQAHRHTREAGVRTRGHTHTSGFWAKVRQATAFSGDSREYSELKET